MTKYECLYRDKSLGDVSLGILGRHNALNSLSAVAVAMDLGLDFKTIREGLSSFRGVGRRMERVGEAGGVLVMDDYGHHPRIRATWTRSRARRAGVVFPAAPLFADQVLWEEFRAVFFGRGVLFLTECTRPGEPLGGGGGCLQLIRQAIAKHTGREARIFRASRKSPFVAASSVKGPRPDAALLLQGRSGVRAVI